jgi:ATP-dependent Clp protease ATP-binding subunit ClpA
MDAFKQEFSPEFINRIDEVIFFNQLTRKDAESITKLNLLDLPIKITKKLVSHVVDNAYSPEYGARNIKRYIKQNVTLKLADKILNGSEAKQFKPKFQEGELHVEEI